MLNVETLVCDAAGRTVPRRNRLTWSMYPLVALRSRQPRVVTVQGAEVHMQLCRGQKLKKVEVESRSTYQQSLGESIPSAQGGIKSKGGSVEGGSRCGAIQQKTRKVKPLSQKAKTTDPSPPSPSVPRSRGKVVG